MVRPLPLSSSPTHPRHHVAYSPSNTHQQSKRPVTTPEDWAIRLAGVNVTKE